MMWRFWHYHTSNPGYDHILTSLKQCIIKYDVPGIGPGIGQQDVLCLELAPRTPIFVPSKEI